MHTFSIILKQDPDIVIAYIKKEIESNSASTYTVQAEDFSASNDIPIDLDGPI